MKGLGFQYITLLSVETLGYRLPSRGARLGFIVASAVMGYFGQESPP